MRFPSQPENYGPTPTETDDSARREMPEGTRCIEAETIHYFEFGGFFKLNVKADETDRSRFDFQLLLADAQGRQYRMSGVGRREK